MSIFSGIENAAHTFVGWIESEWTKFEKAAPSIEALTEAGAKYAVGVLTIVSAQVEPGSEAAKIISTALADIETASAVVYDAGAHPSVATLWQDIVGNLGALETATGIKNPGTVATVAKVISTLAALAQAFLAIAPAV